MVRLLAALAGLFVLGLFIGGAIAFTTRPTTPGPVAVVTPTPVPLPSAGSTPTSVPTVAPPATPQPTTSPTLPPTPIPTPLPTATVVPATLALTPAPTPAQTSTPEAPAPTPTPAVADPAAIPQFIADLSDAIANGTNRFLFRNLHPEVLVRYGEQLCRTYTATTQMPGLEIEYVSDTGPAPWDWTLDEITTTIPDAQTVTVNWRDPNVDETRDVHIAPSEGTWRWFTDCGDPLT